MNLNEITTVTDLVNKNEEAPLNLDQLLTLCQDNLGYEDAIRLATAIVDKVAGFHRTVAEEYINGGEPEKATAWTHDQAILTAALLSLQQVTLD